MTDGTCYFCGLPGVTPHRYNVECFHCPQENIPMVVTTRMDGRLIYAHIYTGPSVANFLYHIRLDFECNSTHIIKAARFDDIVLPGLHITPSNALNRLKTILTFL